MVLTRKHTYIFILLLLSCTAHSAFAETQALEIGNYSFGTDYTGIARDSPLHPALDSKDVLHIIYLGSTSELMYGKISQGVFTKENVYSSTNRVENRRISFALNSLDIPVVAYVGQDNVIRYARKSNDVWSIEDVPRADGNQQNAWLNDIFLVFDSSDNPVIGQTMYGTYSNRYVLAYSEKTDDWKSKIMLDTRVIDDLQKYRTEPVVWTLFVDSDNRKHVFAKRRHFGESTKKEVVHFWENGEQLSSETVDQGDSDITIYGYDIDSSGKVHLVYSIGSTIKHAVLENEEWKKETVDFSNNPHFLTFMIDSSDIPVIFFYDYTSSSAKHIRRENNEWKIVLLEPSPKDYCHQDHDFRRKAFLLDNANRPHVLCFGTFYKGYAEGGSRYDISLLLMDDRLASGSKDAGDDFIEKPTNEKQSFSIHLKKGWNMISSPIAAELRRSDIEPTCPLNEYKGEKIWAYQKGTWKNPSQISANEGYYVHSESECKVSVFGVPAKKKVSLSQGWNLISGNGSLDSVKGNCTFEGTQGKRLWHWEGGWKNPMLLEPSKAYWVYVKNACVTEG